MAKITKPKKTKGTRPVPPASDAPQLVQVVHTETGRTKFVRPAHVARMAPAWQIVADEPPVTPEPQGSDPKE